MPGGATLPRYGKLLLDFGRRNWSAWLRRRLDGLKWTPTKLARELGIVRASRIGEWLKASRLVTPAVAFAVGARLRELGSHESSGAIALFASGHLVQVIRFLREVGVLDPVGAVDAFCLLPVANYQMFVDRRLPLDPVGDRMTPERAGVAAMQIAKSIGPELEKRAWNATLIHTAIPDAKADRRAYLAWVHATGAIALAETLAAAEDFPVLEVYLASWNAMVTWAHIAAPTAYKNWRSDLRLVIPPEPEESTLSAFQRALGLSPKAK